MKIKISLITILLFLCSTQIVFAQDKNKLQEIKYPICSDCATLPKPLLSPKPEYPKEAEAAGAFGKVKIQMTINEEGSVVEAKAISGNPLLFEASVAAALKAKFSPAKMIGSKIPVKSVGVITYNFVLDEPNLPKQTEKQPQENSESTKISLGIVNNNAIILPQLKYPKEILQPRTKGDVYVQVKINLQAGNVVSAAAISGNPLFKKYAEQAAMLAKFQPKKIEGSPLFATGIIFYKHPSESSSVQQTKTGLPVIVVGVVNNRAVHLPKPIYPKSCSCLGTIKVRIVIDMNGNVISATADLGNPLLRSSAVQAARKTKFSPTLISGQSVFVVAFLEYKFYSNGKVST